MKKFLKLLYIEGKLALRSIDLVFFGVVMPVAIAVLIGMIGGSDKNYIQENVPAIMTVGICATAFMGIPLSLAEYRDKKILKHYFVTPVSPVMILAVQVFKNFITAIISAVAVYSAMGIFFGYKITGSISKFILAYILVTAAMYGIGILMASLCRSIKAINLACTIVYFPMLFLSGATIPFSVFPSVIQKIANILPLTQGIILIKGYSLGTETNLMAQIIFMLLIAVVSSIVSIKYFKWE